MEESMTITINIKPEVEAELARQAEVRGMDVPAYATTLLEAAARPPRAAKSRTLEEFERTLDRIAQFADEIPALPDEAFSRESLYQDHD
jgi:post-segregation antitoxin (ccd killing protein)